VFDEAQRAWNAEQTSKFMQQKKGQLGFSMSEPEFLLGVMDRHKDWCTIICLVGGGQEINTGEAGIDEWLRALARAFPHWRAYLPEALEQQNRSEHNGKPKTHQSKLHRRWDVRNWVVSGQTAFVIRLLAPAGRNWVGSGLAASGRGGWKSDMIYGSLSAVA